VGVAVDSKHPARWPSVLYLLMGRTAGLVLRGFRIIRVALVVVAALALVALVMAAVAEVVVAGSTIFNGMTNGKR
jgi:hypothetical protein